MAHRSLVAPHLYDDVIPCLDFLTKDLGVRVAVLTNGNANLTSCTALGKYLTLTLGNYHTKKYTSFFLCSFLMTFDVDDTDFIVIFIILMTLIFLYFVFLILKYPLLTLTHIHIRIHLHVHVHVHVHVHIHS